MIRQLPNDYEARVYAGWLGKCAGVRLGAPVEAWTFEQIQETLGEISDFLPLPPGKLFKPDDDTAFPLIMLRALEDHGPEVTAQQMGETMLGYVADQRGTLWWGGYGVSTEHTAYLNLAQGIPAPRSGSAAQNGRGLAEQIGGQIFSDIWGLVAPNEPALAAELAARAARVTHDGEAVQGGRYIAALVSLAFGERDPHALVRRGLAVLEPGSEYARVVQAVLGYHAAHPQDWRAGFELLRSQFGYDRYPGMVPIIPNAGIVVLALLYSGGDLSTGIRIATMAGWDTDCNAGNVGCILGVAGGLAGIDWRWRGPMNDLLVGASITGAANLTTVPAFAERLSRQGARLAGGQTAARPRLHFDYPGSTHGMQGRGRGAEVIDLRQEGGSLGIVLRGLGKKGEAEVMAKSYCRPGDLSANYYGASFSPTIYPGQTVTARLAAPENAGQGLLAALAVWDDNGKQRHVGPMQPLSPGAWTDVRLEIPPLHNALLAEVGVVLRTVGEAWSGRLLLDDLDWGGPPRFSTDFSAERHEFGAISQWTFLRGYWRLEKGGYHGSGAASCESYTGDPSWTDLRLAATLRPLLGETHLLLVRVQGARRCYAVGLAPNGRLAIYKNAGGYRQVAATPFAWRQGAEYRLHVKACGPGLEAAVEGGPSLHLVDEESPYLSGQIGLAGLHGSHLACSRLEVEGLA